MARSRKRKRFRPAMEKVSSQDQIIIQQTVAEYRERRAAHIAAHGSTGPHPASTAWIDLPVGSPERQYLDEYMKTGKLPDVRTAEDPVAANAVWDYLEQQEAAGTLPLCIVPLSSPVPEEHRHLVDEAARREGIDPRNVRARMRPVRSQGASGGGDTESNFVISMEWSDPPADE